MSLMRKREVLPHERDVVGRAEKIRKIIDVAPDGFVGEDLAKIFISPRRVRKQIREARTSPELHLLSKCRRDLLRALVLRFRRGRERKAERAKIVDPSTGVSIF